jgi:hypothetical protein
MNTNGTGLVLASMALADHPRVLVPIVFYNLVQHLVAGFIDRIVSRTIGEEPPGGAVATDDRKRYGERRSCVSGEWHFLKP